MSARQDDDRCIAQMWLSITQLQQRIADVGMTRETFTRPRGSLESLLAEGAYHMLERSLEECTNLTVDTMFEYRSIPWNKVIGLRNRMVHDYPGTNHDVLWNVIEDDLPALKDACEDYCARRGVTPQELASQYPDDIA